jgi:hypothetical protein
VFRWTKSADLDANPLIYILSVTVGGRQFVTTTSDTQLVIHFPSLQLPDSALTVPIVWGVAVTDGQDTVLASNDPGGFSLWVLVTGVPVKTDGIPHAFALHQNFPNPFNPTTMISYDIPRISEVRMDVYNTLGMKVRSLFEGHQAAGSYQISWDGKNDAGKTLSSGVYFYRITANAQSSLYTFTKKMLFMK